MKTLVGFFIALTLLAGASHAQQIDPEFNKPASWSNRSPEGDTLQQALDTLREKHHFHVEMKTIPTKRITGKLDGMDLKKAITRLAETADVKASFSGQTVTITAKDAPPAAPTSLRVVETDMLQSSGVVIHTNPHDPSQSRQALAEVPAYGPPQNMSQAYAAQTAMQYASGGNGTTMLMNLASELDPNLMIGAMRPVGWGMRGGWGNPMYRQPYGFGAAWIADCASWPTHAQCTHGDLKIDGGGERFLQGIDIVVDGYNRGPASRFNNRYNHGLPLTVGEHHVQFVRVSDEMVVYEVQVLIESRYVTKNNPNLVKVDRNRIENGPHRKLVVTVPNDRLPRQEPEEVLRTPGPVYRP